MNVICKTNSPGYKKALFINKRYTVIREYENFYLINCELDIETWIDAHYFMNKKEERKYKLEKLKAL